MERMKCSAEEDDCKHAAACVKLWKHPRYCICPKGYMGETCDKVDNTTGMCMYGY